MLKVRSATVSKVRPPKDLKSKEYTVMRAEPGPGIEALDLGRIEMPTDVFEKRSLRELRKLTGHLKELVSSGQLTMKDTMSKMDLERLREEHENFVSFPIDRQLRMEKTQMRPRRIMKIASTEEKDVDTEDQWAM
jgi:hypothetical protein